MSMQARGPEGQAYKFERDLRQCYPQIIQLVARRFNNESWPEMVDVVQAAGGSWDGLCDAMEAIQKFLTSPITDPEITMEQVLRESGWFRVTDADRAGLCAMFGSVMLGQLHHAVRETTPLGAAAEDIQQSSYRTSQLLLHAKKEKVNQE